MKCFGEYSDDRVCGLCSICNKEEFNKCKNEYDEKMELNNKLNNIQANCPHRREGWDEYQRYDKCDIKPCQDDECYVTLTCKQYLEECDDS
ncbi:hypothetical protein G8S49_06575 [Clostridium botulinum C]|uniref:Uncharacterized protein n=2 Tax=Clostridium botulinum TaxID=1491 RepID=A0A9Q4XUN5_CLOBO|nr:MULTISPECIES: hypothetical protein [Clostridium]YP_398471.1 hypothetical protein CST041 [Clostridium phage c-st]MCD3196065.1 hypothetical protein [Clostridium botulinum C]MCD3200356.1 hypothetical protein [Clostridium botulinum C]MCD3206889.1 hypothetical protein [Clostridium botulinum C]MCD3207588.1 hypothetical protein [Clostridium botulinum C]MCD3226322.1 hypothetical protein [Clostridium botulinum C]